MRREVQQVLVLNIHTPCVAEIRRYQSTKIRCIADADRRNGGKIEAFYLDPSLGLILIQADRVQGRWVSALNRSSQRPQGVARLYECTVHTYVLAARIGNCRDGALLGGQPLKNWVEWGLHTVKENFMI